MGDCGRAYKLVYACQCNKSQESAETRSRPPGRTRVCKYSMAARCNASTRMRCGRRASIPALAAIRVDNAVPLPAPL